VPYNGRKSFSGIAEEPTLFLRSIYKEYEVTDKKVRAQGMQALIESVARVSRRKI
jgi:hypothetical protein